MSDALHWTVCVYRSVPWPESHEAVGFLGHVDGASDAVRSAWVLGRHEAVRGVVSVLLEGTELGARMAAAFARLKARVESVGVEDL